VHTRRTHVSQRRSSKHAPTSAHRQAHPPRTCHHKLHARQARGRAVRDGLFPVPRRRRARHKVAPAPPSPLPLGGRLLVGGARSRACPLRPRPARTTPQTHARGHARRRARPPLLEQETQSMAPLRHGRWAPGSPAALPAHVCAGRQNGRQEHEGHDQRVEVPRPTRTHRGRDGTPGRCSRGTLSSNSAWSGCLRTRFVRRRLRSKCSVSEVCEPDARRWPLASWRMPWAGAAGASRS